MVTREATVPNYLSLSHPLDNLEACPIRPRDRWCRVEKSQVDRTRKVDPENFPRPIRRPFLSYVACSAIVVVTRFAFQVECPRRVI